MNNIYMKKNVYNTLFFQNIWLFKLVITDRKRLIKVKYNQYLIQTTTSPSSVENWFSKTFRSGNICIQLIQQYVKKSSIIIFPFKCVFNDNGSVTFIHSRPKYKN